MSPNLTLFSVNAILILSTDDSSRILAKYYNAPHPPIGTPAGSTNYPGANPYPTVKEQKAFEKGLLEKTAKQTTDVILYDNRVVVFKQESDIMMASSVLNCCSTLLMASSMLLEAPTRMRYYSLTSFLPSETRSIFYSSMPMTAKELVVVLTWGQELS
jgi:hypothetical protein